MIDPKQLGEPNNVVIHPDVNNKNALKAWAKSADLEGHQLWLQLNHPGKQTPSFLTKSPVAPSAVSLKPPLDKVFNTPRALTVNEIKTIVSQFAYAAKATKEAEFHGVQIHGAHGYLVSQFLSPVHNIREDEWGGAIENRFKFVKEVYLAMRKAVGDRFPIGIKLNSADFSKGGFSPEESVYVAMSLSELGIDLIEISGGSYEKPVMMGETIKESTKKREAYFLYYTKEIRSVVKCPLMVTGGFGLVILFTKLSKTTN